MLYELIGVVRPGKVLEVKEIAKTAGTLVLNAGGVVRGITNWGTFLLPKPYRKHQQLHTSGHYFIMRFDSSAKTQHSVRRTLSLDPRMIKYSVVKMGDKLEAIKEVGGQAEWASKKGKERDALSQWM
ncbi:30S ribosomal protein S6 [Coniosporium apollinis CBS 100218]|uniref:Small ribosomal subunit protein bS6m n=1 Tax=Coniosporium apollinis (strain CBS 100218) TaxID=1168221 RepID=R7Z6W5_CONA1|nr:30S ribosomal protein S6 [Coniosporium apollinis CBS 100218]EON69754.1 30S ribosomal protein S6 [Coniosporium apollinis CBS 100218]